MTFLFCLKVNRICDHLIISICILVAVNHSVVRRIDVFYAYRRIHEVHTVNFRRRTVKHIVKVGLAFSYFTNPIFFPSSAEPYASVNDTKPLLFAVRVYIFIELPSS